MSKDPKSSYYDAGNIEAYDVIKAKLTKEQLQGYLLGNILKYAQRANHKGSFDRDVDKIVNYSCWLKESIVNETEAVGSCTFTLNNVSFDSLAFDEKIGDQGFNIQVEGKPKFQHHYDDMSLERHMKESLQNKDHHAADNVGTG